MGCIQSKKKNVKIHKSDEISTIDRPSMRARNSTFRPSMYVSENMRRFSERYSKVRQLGMGAYGEVWLCIDKENNQERAVKIMKKSKTNSKSQDKIIEEIDLLKTFDHPNLMKIHEFFTNSNYYHVITELYHGGELFDEILRLQSFSEKDAAIIMKQILSGVAYLHKHNIVHRDLKPENILYETKEKDSLIKIVDFGLSTVIRNGEPVRDCTGTAYYVAPEVLKKSYDEKSDIWSCGVIMFILLCGYPPFGGKNDSDILRKVKNGKVSFLKDDWKDISLEARDLCKAMLTYDPVYRISALEALSYKWITVLTSYDYNPPNILTKCRENLKRFKEEDAIGTAVVFYIASKLSTNQERKELTDTFMQLDTNGDGQLDRNELIKGYKNLIDKDSTIALRFWDTENIENEVDAILEACDLDQNSYIDYSEFIGLFLEKNAILSDNKLKNAFSMLDRDQNGKISRSDMRKLSGLGKLSIDEWNKMIKSADSDHDGEVNYQEFIHLMNNLCDDEKSCEDE